MQLVIQELHVKHVLLIEKLLLQIIIVFVKMEHMMKEQIQHVKLVYIHVKIVHQVLYVHFVKLFPIEILVAHVHVK